LSHDSRKLTTAKSNPIEFRMC